MQPQDSNPSDPVVTPPTPSSPRRQISVPNFNFWQILTAILLIAVVVMVFMWKPWQPNIKASERTISVTGNATVSATPDEYAFSPSYTFTASSKQTALNNLTNASNKITAKLKSLGVPDKDIKTDSSGYGTNTYYLPSSAAKGQTTYTLYLTVTVDDSKLAQKVQDYLLTTGPTGSVSPSVSFSKSKQQQVQDQARSKAEENARTQADQSAKKLGFKVDAVKSVKDGNLGGLYPYSDIFAGANAANSAKAQPHLSLQPGQNDLSYSVQVVYYIH